MKIITLNMAMFNFQINDSLNVFLNEYKPDVAIIQECRHNKIANVQLNPIEPNYFGKKIDSTYFLTVAFCKDKKWNRNNLVDSGEYNHRHVAIERAQNINSEFSILGIHIPAEKSDNKEDVKKFISIIKESKFDIICGDFNASFQKRESINYIMLEELKELKKYSNLWEQGLNEDKAYYIDYKGHEHKVEKDNENKESNYIRTYFWNRHIDYILGKEIDLKKIVIDMRTLVFTDHCAIIVDCEKANTPK